MRNLRILYIGDIGLEWTNSTKHWNSIKNQCKEANSVNLIDLSNPSQRRILRRLDGEAFTQRNLNEANERVLAAAIKFKPQILWFEKPLMIKASTLKKIKSLNAASILICRQDDNPFGLRVHEKLFWKYFIEAIPCYDLHFIKREKDRFNFIQHGAKNISFYWVGYDANHFFYEESQLLTKKDIDFSFIGANLDDRSNFILSLQKNLDTEKFIVAGSGWNHSMLKYKFPKQVTDKLVEDKELRNIFLRSHACLGLFCTSNQDEFSGRAFMITGCGGTLVAPRTKMHEFFFKDKNEALFYEGIEECSSLIKALISDTAYGNYIAKNGARRAINNGYSIDSRISNSLDEIELLLNQV